MIDYLPRRRSRLELAIRYWLFYPFAAFIAATDRHKARRLEPPTPADILPMPQADNDAKPQWRARHWKAG